MTSGTSGTSGTAGPIEITDPTDPRVIDYVGLTDVVRRVRHEPEKGFFLAEGLMVMRRAVVAGCPPRSLLLSPARVRDLLPELRGLDCPTYVVSAEVLEAVTGFHVHRGALGAFGRLPLPSAEQVLGTSQRLLVLENVNSPTNLGAIFRSAAGLGIDGVLLNPLCCDPLYRRAMRVSMGEVLALPYAYLDSWPAGLDQVRAAGFRVLAMTPAAGATDLAQVVLAEHDKAALLLGAEGPGLTDEALAGSDLRVRLPMARDVDSLNVAAAAAIGCWVVGRRPV